MKTPRTTSLLAIGALLPLAAWAGSDARTQNQSTTIQREAYDPRPSETRSGPPSARESESSMQTPRESRIDHSRVDTVGTPTSAAVASRIEYVKTEELDHRVTASDLIGTKVVDREGQEIGKVKDIGLSGVAPQLAPQPDSVRSGDAELRASGLSDTSPRSVPEGEARVFVKTARALDSDGALVAIPATQLHREGNVLRVDISREELRSIVAMQDTNRVSMNR